MLGCAFEHKISPENYEGILLALLQRLSIHQAVDVVAHCTDKPYMEVYMDAKAVSTPVDEAQIPQTVKNLLLPCGYTEWLEEAHDASDFVPSYLMTTYMMVKCAFPDDISQGEYWALISLLHPHMSNRALGRVLGTITGEEYFKGYFDAAGFNSHTPVDANIVEIVTKRLINCGYEEWLLSE